MPEASRNGRKQPEAAESGRKWRRFLFSASRLPPSLAQNYCVIKRRGKEREKEGNGKEGRLTRGRRKRKNKRTKGKGKKEI